MHFNDMIFNYAASCQINFIITYDLSNNFMFNRISIHNTPNHNYIKCV